MDSRTNLQSIWEWNASGNMVSIQSGTVLSFVPALPVFRERHGYSKQFMSPTLNVTLKQTPGKSLLHPYPGPAADFELTKLLKGSLVTNLKQART